MYRRVFFTFPDATHTRSAVEELVKGAGIDRRHMHTIAREGIDLAHLPVASSRQRRDLAKQLERILWNGNLLIFGLALLILLAAWAGGFSPWPWLLIMGVTFFAGQHFAAKVPNVHLDEFKGALRHGEILLMVDVPRWRVPDVENIVLRHHPDAVPGGVGWAIEAFGI